MKVVLSVLVLTFVAGCGNYNVNTGPYYVKPEAADLDLNYISLTAKSPACDVHQKQPGASVPCSHGAASSR